MKLFIRHNRIILLAIFIIMASFGVQLGMSQMIADAKTPCPFMGEAMSLCPMSVMDHISSWKQMFSALPTVELLTLIAAVVIIASFGLKKLADSAAARLAYWYHYYKKKRTLEKFFNYFNSLFSQGILHPKLYA
ncbi:hypothetical protein A2477_02755 [Candidatus Falkowbacteria bacterium RIFOXYC2_FULL_47_12]|uniref:Uncharacterized protein n=2 Tax=Candidatus Falkowiibacteriota TaxID=1752728 RepID=A0A1F5TNG0_9BACT|nr:MAG: hypothetical protein A2242_02395 [Candidatus Falkowbacteria bacterium RIFOXYA2_FULL_47_9]OGF40398.1 MAG: hypothetical protein A2477_02755 [Candidatus Falkowbacteria bacterium RIFOXYC2_FULL_47_12]